MEPDIAIAISVLALIVSAITAWLTLLKRGTLLMTRPTQIYFGSDRSPGKDGRPSLKIYLRTLLYSTAKRGRIVEGMYVRLRRRETVQNFNVWVHGEEHLHIGSGLFVPDSGVSLNHHFLLPQDGTEFKFLAGDYMIDVYASIVGKRDPHPLKSIALTVTAEQAVELTAPGQGLYFDWGPEVGQYHSHIRQHPKSDLPPFLRDLLGE